MAQNGFEKAHQLIKETCTDQKCPVRSSRNFIFLQQIGEGAYSSVYRAREVTSNAEFAIKTIEKSHVNRNQKMESIIREKNIMHYLTQYVGPNPFLCQLYTAFHDQQHIYFVTNFAERGDLTEALNHFGSFDIPTTQFFSSEILYGVEFLHMNGILHRDLKPDNVLIKSDGHIMIADFGSAQVFGKFELPTVGFGDEDQNSSRSSDSDSPPMRRYARYGSDDDEKNMGRRTTFVGTAQYVSPEMLSDGNVGPQSDIWALGCIIFQCLSGQPPFRAVNQFHMMKKIQDLDYSYPEGFPEIANALISQILIKLPENRYNIDQIKNSEFFKGTDWNKLSEKEPPILHAYIPATFGEPEFHSNIDIPEPGLDEKALLRLMNVRHETTAQVPTVSSITESLDLVMGIQPRSDSQTEKLRKLREEKLEKQKKENEYHCYTNNQLILKQGFLLKKRGLFFKRRLFLLTEGPHFLYIDAEKKVLKGEIPWAPDMQIELKNSKTFFIHTPNRVYYLFDAEQHADVWCDAVEKVRKQYEHEIQTTYNHAMKEGTYTSIYGKKKSKKDLMREQKAVRRKQEKEMKKAAKTAENPEHP